MPRADKSASGRSGRGTCRQMAAAICCDIIVRAVVIAFHRRRRCDSRTLPWNSRSKTSAVLSSFSSCCSATACAVAPSTTSSGAAVRSATRSREAARWITMAALRSRSCRRATRSPAIRLRRTMHCSCVASWCCSRCSSSLSAKPPWWPYSSSSISRPASLAGRSSTRSSAITHVSSRLPSRARGDFSSSTSASRRSTAAAARMRTRCSGGCSRAASNHQSPSSIASGYASSRRRAVSAPSAASPWSPWNQPGAWNHESSSGSLAIGSGAKRRSLTILAR